MTRSGIATRHIQANGLNFCVGSAGSGPRLLFISGSNGDLRKENSPLNSQLTQYFEVLSYDQRGMGQSDKPDQPYCMRDYAEDAVAILDELRWQTVNVVGYSFGGMVAQELCLGWPDRVNRLALLATTAGGAGGSSYPIQEFSNLSAVDRARRSLEVADLAFSPQWQQENPGLAQEKIAARLQAQAMFSDEPGAKTGTTRQLEARAQHNTFDKLESIKQPVLVLAGDRDGQAPAAAQRAMAEQIPNCQFKIIEGSHGMLWETDEAYLEVTKFMSIDC